MQTDIDKGVDLRHTYLTIFFVGFPCFLFCFVLNALFRIMFRQLVAPVQCLKNKQKDKSNNRPWQNKRIQNKMNTYILVTDSLQANNSK